MYLMMIYKVNGLILFCDFGLRDLSQSVMYFYDYVMCCKITEIPDIRLNVQLQMKLTRKMTERQLFYYMAE